MINNTLVVENRSKGVSYSRTNLRVQPDTGRVISRSNIFITPLSVVEPDPAIEEMLQPYRDELAERFDEKIAVATGRFPRGGNIERRQEVAIGDLIAESMRSTYGTQLALTNGGGIRSPLPSTYVPQDTTLDRTDPPPYDLVVGDPYTVLPFGNVVVTRDVTGSQLWDALEHGVAAVAADGSSTNGRFPQIAGFRFVFDSRLAVGSRVLAVTLPDGTAIPDDGTSYSLALPDFLNAGGDGYTMFEDEHGVTRDLMAAVMLEHIRSLGTVSPTVDGRIRNCATVTPPCP
jgi:5'-nucleotidase